MKYESFLHLVPASEHAKSTAQTLHLWHAIFYFVLENGEADIADYDDFVQHIQHERDISEKAIGRHLARMAEAGLLTAHKMRRKADTGTLALSRMLWASEPPLASNFTRYTLPAKEPSLRLRRSEKMWKRMTTDMKKTEWPEEFSKFGIKNPFSIHKE